MWELNQSKVAQKAEESNAEDIDHKMANINPKEEKTYLLQVKYCFHVSQALR